MVNMHPYAIYVTAGESEYNPQYEWGGCHITISGFENCSEVTIKKKADAIAKKFFSKGSQWKPTDFTINKWKGRWTIIIKSRTLREIANRFFEAGLKSVKGPDFSGTHFHITLPIDLNYEEALIYAESLAHQEWYITVVESNEKRNKFKWCKYFPLRN